MKKGKWQVIRNFVILFFSILFLVSGVGCIYADSLFGKINYAAPESKVQTGSLFEPGSNSQTASAKAGVLGGLFHDDAVTNILLLGTDDYQVNDIGRSDSMMLVSVDTRHKKLKITSFMRDLYVAIPGYKSNKLNAAYSDGGGGPNGAKLVVKTIESNFGFDIDRFVIIDNSAFNKIINRLGGVTITLTNERDSNGNTEADLINMYSGDSRKVHTGVNNLTGAQAHYYSRIRDIGNDYERTQRQRKVFTSLVDKLKKSDLFTIGGILADTMNLVHTNMTKDEVINMAKNSLTYLKYPVSQDRIPADDAFTTETIAGVGDSLVPDLEKCRKNISDFIYEGDVPQKSYGNEG